MKNLIFSVLAFTIFSSGCSTMNPAFERSYFSGAGVHLRITSNKNIYKEGEPIYLDVKIINCSSMTLKAYQSISQFDSVEIIIANKEGDLVPYTGAIPSTSSSDKLMGDLYYGEYFGAILKLTGGRDPDYVIKKGEYTVVVLYGIYNNDYCYLYDIDGSGNTIKYEYCAPLVSNQVSFIVK